jgi:phenylacetate-CoA ligase
MLIIRGVNVFPSQVEAALAQVPELSLHYFLEVTERKGLKELCVVCELKDSLSGKELEAVERKTSRVLHEVLGIRVGLRLEQPGTVERSSGKAARIVRVN